MAENLRLFARLEKLADPEAAVRAMLAQTGLADRADDEVGACRAAISSASTSRSGCCASRRSLLLDEPSASLDPRQRERLWEFIGELCGGARRSCSRPTTWARPSATRARVLVLVDGELLFAGTAAELSRTVGGDPRDLEAAFVRFLHARGH